MKKDFIFNEINKIKGVGPQLSKYLKKRKIEKIKDIILNLPYSETDRSKIYKLNELEVGQVREGKVTSLKDFGVFVDLGGIDGLLHITDLSWGRVNHPSEVLSMNDLIKTYLGKYLLSNDLTDKNEMYLRLSVPLTIYFVIWTMKAFSK